jgi:hypothetical protein
MESTPAQHPTSNAPHGWMTKSEDDPTATPPANVAFWMSTILHTKTVIRSDCGHKFCTMCMTSQFKLTDNGNQCALCRQTLMKDVASTTTDIASTTQDIMQFIPVEVVRIIQFVVINMVCCWILWWWKISVEAKVCGVGKHTASHRVY